MYENNRDSFSHRNQDEDRRNEDPGSRWRRAEDRYRRESYGEGNRFGENRFDDDRWEAQRRQRDFGYGRTFRDDDYARGAYGDQDWREQRGYALRDYYAARDFGHREPSQAQGGHWHERDHERRAGHPYTGTYGGTGDSSYFTGQQGSWAVGEPRSSGGYYGGSSHYGGGERYGEDYRSHGYTGGGRYGERRGFWDRASDEVASWFGDEDAARRRDQDHRGRGPKNYTRSDERIREDANDRLTEDPLVDASDITVTVNNGEITLDGTVHSRLSKRRAEDCVEDISGVKHVQNNLRVQEAVATGAGSGAWPAGRSGSTETGSLSQSGSTATSSEKV